LNHIKQIASRVNTESILFTIRLNVFGHLFGPLQSHKLVKQ